MDQIQQFADLAGVPVSAGIIRKKESRLLLPAPLGPMRTVIRPGSSVTSRNERKPSTWMRDSDFMGTSDGENRTTEAQRTRRRSAEGFRGSFATLGVGRRLKAADLRLRPRPWREGGPLPMSRWGPGLGAFRRWRERA